MHSFESLRESLTEEQEERFEHFISFVQTGWYEALAALDEQERYHGPNVRQPANEDVVAAIQLAVLAVETAAIKAMLAECEEEA